MSLHTDADPDTHLHVPHFHPHSPATDPHADLHVHDDESAHDCAAHHRTAYHRTAHHRTAHDPGTDAL